jgi:hypothetical protein
MALDFPNSPTVGQFFTSGGLSWQWDGAKWTQAGGANAGTPVSPPSGRLTLTSGVPVMTADVAAATTIYYTPYAGNSIPIYNGTVFVPYAFAELSLALSATAHIAGGLYDLFVWNNAGTLQLITGPAWSSVSVRATALAMLSGIYVNAAAMTGIASNNTPVTVPINQATFLGTFSPAGASGTAGMIMNPAPASGGSNPRLYLWNMYNRIMISALNSDNGASYTYASNVWRQARGSANNQINLIIGLSEDSFVVSTYHTMSTGAVTGNGGYYGGIAYDTAATADFACQGQTTAAVALAVAGGVTKTYPARQGYHTVVMTEMVYAGTSTYSFPEMSLQLRM